MTREGNSTLAAPGDPDIRADAPIGVRDSRPILGTGAPHLHFMPSLTRAAAGRLVLTYSQVCGIRRLNNAALVTARSENDGATWSAPEVLDEEPGWDCVNMGGLMPFGDDRLVLASGRLQMDLSLPGDEPCTGWFLATRTSQDGGETWTPIGPEIRLFPEWTEFYGASNPQSLADGRHMLVAIGTTSRDSGWRAGVTFSSDGGATFSPPVIVAEHPEREFGDMDVARLDDGRFLAVARVFGGQESVFTHSNDEGTTWSEPRPTSFAGANIKLQRLRSGAVLCAYRDERGSRTGVACSISTDAGEIWESMGWLATPSDAPVVADSVRAGYPDIAATETATLGCVLHPAPHTDGSIDLRWLDLVDRS